VVAGLRQVELVARAGADGRHHGLHLRVGEDLVDARLLDVQDLAAQRQDGLELESRPSTAVPPAELPSTR
jgi:hypothetical protein